MRMRALLRDRCGGASILAAAALGLATAAMAIAVDLGAMFEESRKLQGIADAAALAAAGQLSATDAAVRATIDVNGARRPIASSVVAGMWSPDAGVAPARRFVAGGSMPNAARVTLTEDAPLYFGGILGLRSIRLARSATATRADLTSFSIGSRLLALDGGIANRLLGALTGSTVSLTVADYEALVAADVDLLAFADALRSEVGLTGASFTQVLATRTTLPRVLDAAAAALAAGGNGAAAAAAARLAESVGPAEITGAQLADLGPLGRQDRAGGDLSVRVNAYALVQAAAQIAGGARQVALSLDAAPAGLLGLTIRLAVGQRMASSPWVAVTEKGDPVVRTTQMRLALAVQAGASPVLQALGVSKVRLPVYVDLAEAAARLSSLGCGGGTRRVTLSVLPSLGHAAIADVAPAAFADFASPPSETPGAIVDVAGLKVAAMATVPFSGDAWQPVTFDGGEIDARVVKTVTSAGTVGAVASALENKVKLTVSYGPFALPDPGISAAIKPLLDVVAPKLDTVAASLLDLLGVRLGQGDVRIDGFRCGVATLVA